MNRVIHFEIHADDPGRAARWYGDVFGWTTQEIPGLNYWTVSTGEGPGIDGGIVMRRGPKPENGAPVNAFVCTIGVESVDAMLARALAAGASEALPKFAVPGVGWQAYVHDPFGNIVGLHKQDASAA
ncbi:MAG TPA: VOC family protein [Terricaulis sp.]|nr:VOC family protein [Terricaulis sp.]